MSKDLNNKSKIFQNSVLYLLSMVVPKIASFIIVPIYSYYLTPEQMGIYTYTSSIMIIMAVFSTMGFSSYWFRNYSSVGDKAEHNGTMFWFMMLWSGGVLMVLLVAMPWMWKLLHTSVPYWPYMLMALITQFLTSMENIPMRMFRVQGQVKYYFIRMVIKSVMNIVLGLLFVVSIRMGVLGRYLAELVTAAVFSVFFIVYMLKNASYKINWKEAKESLVFSIPIVPSSFMRIANSSAVSILTEKRLSLGSVGIFGMASSLAVVIQIVVQALGLTAEPEIFLRRTHKDFPQFFLRTKTLMMFIIGWYAVGCSLFVREAVHLFLSEKYWASWELVQLLAITIVIDQEKTLFENLLVVQNRLTSLILIYGSQLAVTVAALFVMLPRFGEAGIVFSMILASCVSLVMAVICTDMRSFQNLGIARDAGMIVLGIITCVVGRLLDSLPIWGCIASKILLFTVFTILLLLWYRIKLSTIIGQIREWIRTRRPWEQKNVGK